MSCSPVPSCDALLRCTPGLDRWMGLGATAGVGPHWCLVAAPGFRDPCLTPVFSSLDASTRGLEDSSEAIKEEAEEKEREHMTSLLHGGTTVEPESFVSPIYRE